MGRLIGTIIEDGEIAVGETEFEAAAILTVGIARQYTNADDCAAGKEAQEVDEMTGFADDPSPTLLRVERPVIGR